MSSTSSLYSQGFNFNEFLRKGVDPRTGQYTFSVDLYEAPIQARNCPPFTLSLVFSPLNTQDVGLGTGWSFSLPSYEHRQSNRMVSLSTGESYRVTETSSAIFTTDQKLQSSIVKKLDANSFQITYKSGQIETLSNFNDRYNKSVLVDLYASTGRSLSFTYSPLGEIPRLESIKQGSEILLEVKYGTSQVDITKAPNTPEAASFNLILRNNRLTEIRLPWDGASWKFAYESFGHLNQVDSPSGLVEEIRYREQGHRLPTGAPLQAIPYVISHISRPGMGQPAITTSYTYSDYNFFGYGSSLSWRDGEDNLFLARDEYQYTSTVQIQGGTQTKHTYNKFHLLVRSERQQGTKKVIQETTYHATPFATFENQPAQYQLPKTVETTYQDAASGESRKETGHYVFDEWGNPTQDIKPNGIRTDRIYYSPAGEGQNCPPDPHGFQRYLKKETVTPTSGPGPTRSEDYTYTQMPTATGAKATYLVLVKQRQNMEGTQLLTKFEYTYFNSPGESIHTRLQQQVTSLLGLYPTTKKWTYTNPNDNEFAQTMSTTTFDDSTVVEETGYSKWSGLTVTHQNEAGVRTDFYYDSLGRPIRTVTSKGTPYEAEERQEYTILGTNNGSLRTETDAKGLQTRYITDGLDRLRQVEQQDPEDQVFRLIQESSYNAQDQHIATSEIDWLRGSGSPVEQRINKSMEYDDWGNVYRVTENSGLRTLSQTDPITNTKVEGIEGEGITKTKLNLFGAPTQIALHHRDDTLYSKIDYSYDGLGRLVSQVDNLGRATQYKMDSFDRVVETIWPSSRVVKTEYASQTTAVLPTSVKLNGKTVGEQSFDGLGRITRKSVSTRITRQAYSGTSPEPSRITNPSGEQYSLSYQPALNDVVTQLSSSSHTDTYQYDSKTAAPLQLSGSFSTHDLQYQASGLLSQESIQITGDQTYTTHYTYSMSGKLQQYTDPNGKIHATQYDTLGRPQKVVQGRLSVSFVYDNASRVAQTRVDDGEKNTTIRTDLTYDDFGRETKRSVYKGGSTLLYDLSQTYNGIGLVASRLKEVDGSLLRSESFEYDVHNHLIAYRCRGSQSPADKKGNRLQSQSFIFDDYDNIVACSTVFQDGSSNESINSFSADDPTQLTQITNTHPSYPSKVTLEYDASGCLTRDDEGRRLEYDNMSRLTRVRDADDNILAQYLYDAAGKLVCQKVPNQPDTNLFYRGSLIAVKKGDELVSYLSHGSEYWGETTSQQDGSTETRLWASDGHQSVLAELDSQTPDQVRDLQYTPYGSSGSESGGSSSIGFNGQWKDPVTGWYHLGNGYRVYNPQLQRFHTPDPWSPFASGEINPYAYSLGDPINRMDPDGHFSIFGMTFGWKDLVMTGVGIAVSVGVGILTGGASLAIQIGVGIAAGIASDVVSGMIGDVVEGNSISLKSVGLDALGGLVGGVFGEVGGAIIKSAFKATKALPMALRRAVGWAGSYNLAKGVSGEAVRQGLSATVKSGLRASARGFIIATVASHLLVPNMVSDGQDEGKQSEGGSSSLPTNSGGDTSSTNPLGRSGPVQVGSQPFYLDRGSSITRDIIRPLVKDGNDTAISTSFMGNYSGIETSAGRSAVANLLNRDVRFTYGPFTDGQ